MLARRNWNPFHVPTMELLLLTSTSDRGYLVDALFEIGRSPAAFAKRRSCLTTASIDSGSPSCRAFA